MINSCGCQYLNRRAETIGGAKLPAKDCEEHINDLEERIEELESGGGPSSDGLTIGYALGMSIAVVLSWSRNGSILWCMLHGLCSWGYVIFYAWTRTHG